MPSIMSWITGTIPTASFTLTTRVHIWAASNPCDGTGVKGGLYVVLDKTIDAYDTHRSSC